MEIEGMITVEERLSVVKAFMSHLWDNHQGLYPVKRIKEDIKELEQELFGGKLDMDNWEEHFNRDAFAPIKEMLSKKYYLSFDPLNDAWVGKTLCELTPFDGIDFHTKKELLLFKALPKTNAEISFIQDLQALNECFVQQMTNYVNFEEPQCQVDSRIKLADFVLSNFDFHGFFKMNEVTNKEHQKTLINQTVPLWRDGWVKSRFLVKEAELQAEHMSGANGILSWQIYLKDARLPEFIHKHIAHVLVQMMVVKDSIYQSFPPLEVDQLAIFAKRLIKENPLALARFLIFTAKDVDKTKARVLEEIRKVYK